MPTLDRNSEDVRTLVEDIALNLKSVARNGSLERPLRIFCYRLKKGEDFYTVNAKLSQSPDTLASMNDLIHPSEVGAGDMLYIPNARGLYVRDEGSSAKKRELDRRAITLGEGQFIPGLRFEPEHLQLFRGLGFESPLEKFYLSSSYGSRLDPFTRKATFHGGLDMAAPTGTVVRASRAGKVIFSGVLPGYGNIVIIEHKYKYSTYYGHLQKTLVKTGDVVEEKQQIGLVGSTGLSTGPHLHFEVRRNGLAERPMIHRSG